METTKSLVRVDLTEDVCIIDKVDLHGKAYFKVLMGWPISFVAREFLQKLNRLLEDSVKEKKW